MANKIIIIIIIIIIINNKNNNNNIQTDKQCSLPVSHPFPLFPLVHVIPNPLKYCF